ncbi:MAG TPA: hypothetical protein VGR89_02165 [Puia sp.]|nr:hypothetical protein [Puia sp.]
MEKEKDPAISAAPYTQAPPEVACEAAKPCPGEPEVYVEADVPPYEEEFTLSGGCCSGG